MITGVGAISAVILKDKGQKAAFILYYYKFTE